MIAHTPGPWTYEEENGEILSDFGAVGYVYDPKNPDEQTIPNGRLLASAPELLDALQKIASACTENEKNEFTGEGWRKAHEKIGAFARAVLSRFEEGA